MCIRDRSEALFLNPLFVETMPSVPLQSALTYQLQSTSPAILGGTLISGSENSLDFLQNNGGRDFFNQVVPSNNPPSIGAIQHSLCGTGSEWSASESSCVPIDNSGCVGDLDGDGVVGTLDLLLLLSVLSSSC